MSERVICDKELHAHFVTFSCHRRRRLLDHDAAKRVVLDVLNSLLVNRKALCLGFVVMPDHVHAILWFPTPGQLSVFMQQWKRLSSHRLGLFVRDRLVQYSQKIGPNDPIWKPKYYSFNLYTENRVWQKLKYMHKNPVRAGLAAQPSDWEFSSARRYEQGQSVGVPIRWFM